VVKVQSVKAQKAAGEMLQREARMLALLTAKGVKGVPEIFSSILESERYIVSTLMHVSLYELGRRLRRDALEADVFLVAREAGVAITVRDALIALERFSRALWRAEQSELRENVLHQAVLSQLHDNRFLHNDISPDNIMVKVISPDRSPLSHPTTRTFAFYLIGGTLLAPSCPANCLRAAVSVPQWDSRFGCS